MDNTNETAEPSGASGGSTAAHLGNAVEVYRVESADGIVDGNYVGEWSGYEVRFETPFGQYVAELDMGIRGTAKCIVRVLHARVTAEIRKGQ
jgi:hypothetical protein